MKRSLVLALLLIFSCYYSHAEEESESEAYWEYGIGLGAVHYEQYPASNQFSDLALPAPTFQYRGKILRADDREGAHLYIFRAADLTLEISGTGSPALESSNNDARKDMDNLPWMLALGPQLVSRHFPHWELAVGAFQAVTTDFSMTRFQGGVFEGKVTYIHDFDFLYSQGKLSLAAQFATQELQALYYEVPADKVTPDRAAYDAHDGLLGYDLTYYQTFDSGLFTWAAGVSVNFYGASANNESPLHKSDTNVTSFIGINYVLGESKKPAVPQEDTSGFINSLRRNRELRPD